MYILKVTKHKDFNFRIDFVEKIFGSETYIAYFSYYNKKA